MAKKKINFKLIDPLVNREPYDVMESVMTYHQELEPARIAIAWRIGLSEDKDGHLILGKCMKASDLHRELCAV